MPKRNAGYNLAGGISWTIGELFVRGDTVAKLAFVEG